MRHWIVPNRFSKSSTLSPLFPSNCFLEKFSLSPEVFFWLFSSSSLILLHWSSSVHFRKLSTCMLERSVSDSQMQSRNCPRVSQRFSRYSFSKLRCVLSAIGGI